MVLLVPYPFSGKWVVFAQKKRKKKWEEGLKVNMNKLTATEHKCKELTDGSLACHRPAHGKVLTVYSVLTTGGPNATGLPRASYR